MDEYKTTLTYKNETGDTVMTYSENYYYVGGEKLVLEKHAAEILKEAFQKKLLPASPYLIVCLLMPFLAQKAMGGMPIWYITKKVFGIKTKYIARIDLDEAPGGLICVRGWDINRKGYLKSTTRDTIWEHPVMVTADDPDIEGWKGIYAHRLGSPDYYNGKIKGIVSMSGKLVGHEDNVVRGERCEILVLITKSNRIAEKLRSHYTIPVIVTGSIEKTITSWIMSKQGIFWLSHNEKLITIKKMEKFEQDIENIPALRSFPGGE